MKTKKKVAIYIGRFEPAHNGHVETFKYCNKNYDRTLVLIGSKNKRRTLKNPFPVEMVRNWVLENSDRSTQTFPINDYLYSDNKWIAQIEDLVYSIYNKEEHDFTIVGHEKDSSSYYLNNQIKIYCIRFFQFYLSIFPDTYCLNQNRALSFL